MGTVASGNRGLWEQGPLGTVASGNSGLWELGPPFDSRLALAGTTYVDSIVVSV